MNEEQVYVHYNGWGNRWDEWIAQTSPRIAPFRTHTVQNPKANYLSPQPNVPADASQFQTPNQYTGIGDVAEDLIRMMNETQQVLTEFHSKRKEVEKQKKENAKEEEKQMPEET